MSASTRPRPVRVTTPARILTLDIETGPHLASVWGLWNNNVSLSQLRESGGMICWVAKWLDGDEVFFRSIYHDGPDAMVREMHALLDEADIVVTYNGRNFDEKHLRREFLERGLPPVSGWVSVDLLQVVRRNFRFPSNKLDYVSGQLLGSRKVQHAGMGLWNDCLYAEGRVQERAWETMRRYNVQDVKLTEKLYRVLVPYLPASMAVLTRWADDPHTCPRCGSDRLIRDGLDRSTTREALRWRCTRCRSWSRSQGTTLRAVA